MPGTSGRDGEPSSRESSNRDADRAKRLFEISFDGIGLLEAYLIFLFGGID